MKNKILVFIFIGFIFIFSLGSIFIPDKKISYSERRKLKEFPEFEFSGEYISDVDGYLLDHFIFRDLFRSIKAKFNYSVLNKLDNNDIYLNLINGKKISLSEVLSYKDELIVESLIKQTKQFNSFNKTSVNTVRFMTTLYPNGEAKVIATWMKFGRLGAFVDNAGSGGNIDACVDVKSGRICNVVEFNGFRNTKKIDVHPDSGLQLEGIVIDNWEDIKTKVISFQKAFPFVKAAGWDIAMTDEGPIVIEVNDSWDRTGQLFIQRGWKHEIRDCFKAWDKIGCNPIVERFINHQSNKEMRVYQRLFNK